MLVLARRESEAIRIGNDITLRVVRIRGNQVRIGIEAPANVPVKRLELLERVASDSASCSPHAEYTALES